MNSDPIADITNLKASQVYKESLIILEGIKKTWKKDKQFNYKLKRDGNCNINVQTYLKNNLNNVYWCARVTDFKSISDYKKELYYSGFEKYILGSLNGTENSHTEFEKEYIHELTSFKIFDSSILKEGLSENILFNSYLAELTYTFQFPLKTRKFYELICIFKDKENNEGYVVSQCISPSNLGSIDSSNAVIGRYTSIERVSYDEVNKELDWTMCTCSTPGGFIPDWITKLSIKKAISKDVPSFLDWLEKNSPST